MNKQDIEAMARKAGAVAGVKHVTFCDEGGVVMKLDELHAFTALVLEKVAKQMKRRGYHATCDELRAMAEGLKS